MANLIHSIDQPDKQATSTTFLVTVLVIAVVLGILAGIGLTRFGSNQTQKVAPGGTQTDKTAGIADKKTFKDKAEGVLREGGINDEGSYHLEQSPTDRSKDVALTSTTVDLSQYVGKKVRVWGQTYNSDKAGWLMDVGLVEVL